MGIVEYSLDFDMSRFPIAAIFISFAAVLGIRSGTCYGFAVVRRTSRSLGHTKLVVSPMMMTTEPTSRFEPSGEEEAAKSTDAGRMSTRKRLSNLTRRFLHSFRPFKRTSMEREASLDDASQRNASPMMIQVDDTKGLISQVEKTIFALPSDGQGTPLDGVSPRDVLIQTGEMQVQIAPIEDMSVIHIDDPVMTRHTRSADHGK
jgi:hypothetical protein